MIQRELTEEQLITTHIIPRPNGRSRAEARIIENGMHVWALIGYLRGVNWDLEDAAQAYEISQDSIAAALAFYRQNQALIDAKLLLNDAEFED